MLFEPDGSRALLPSAIGMLFVVGSAYPLAVVKLAVSVAAWSYSMVVRHSCPTWTCAVAVPAGSPFRLT